MFSFLQPSRPRPTVPRPAEAKASRTAALVALLSQGRARWTPRDYASLAREGFARNAVAYRAVRLVCEAVGTMPYVLQEAGRDLDGHPLQALLAHPHPRMRLPELLEAVCGHLLVAGNAYLEVVCVEGVPREIHVLRPDRMKVVPGADGWPEAYDYTLDGRTLRIPQSGEGMDTILHLTLFNPLDDHYGFPPLEAAAQALDLHNASGAWNKALIDNAARPSGALVYGGTGSLSDDQFERLKSELEASFQGSANAGRPLLLEGGLDWKPLALTPKDMDFEAARAGAAREIALALGVPPMLLGIPGDATYSNYAEANRALWRLTAIPLARRIGAALCGWFAPLHGPDLALVPDLDQVEALAQERAALWSRVAAADFLTEDEKRAAVGYGPKRVDGVGV
ncbi:phage portal protein [Aquabacter cavernae]|uniref:phage portal protein n=1 Tax=Aquabacter cavernae TaxID=2496029 RepID=UPI000F8EAABB|nr:phage portal protein [Aquabacter cavernae]